MARLAKPWVELTSVQQLNRQRNEAAKAKRMNVYNITGEDMVKKTEPTIKNKAEEQNNVISSNPWIKIVDNAMSPSVAIPASCLLILSSYLVWQYTNTPQGDIATGCVIEAIGIIYATIATISKSKLVKFIATLSIFVTILYTSVILHSSLKINSYKNDDYSQSLIKQRDVLQKMVDSESNEASEMSSSHVSKKQQLRTNSKNNLDKIEKLNTEINSVKVSSSNDVFAGLIIRILAMVANAYMVHLVVKGIRK